MSWFEENDGTLGGLDWICLLFFGGLIKERKSRVDALKAYDAHMNGQVLNRILLLLV